MVRVSPPSLSASSGELSELMYARRDFSRFQNGARACRGFLPLPEGPATRLPGTRFMGFTHNAGAADARLMAFVFRDEDAVLLEWTANLLRFWRNGSPVLSAGVPYSIAAPYSLAQARHLQSLQSSDRIYLTDGVQPPQTLSRFSLTNWTLAPTVFQNGPFADRNLDQSRQVVVSGSSGVITIVADADIFGAHHVGTLMQLLETDNADTPYWAADVKADLNDRVYYDGKCYGLVDFDGRAGKTGSSFPAIWGGSPPATYTDNQVIWTNIAYSALYADWQANTLVNLGNRRNSGLHSWEVTGFTTAPGSRTTGVNPPTHLEGDWLAEKGGPVWRYLHDGAGIVRITAVADARHATATVEKAVPDGLTSTPTYRWAEQAWSNMRGWPCAIGAYEQRHIYGGTPSEPRRLWHGVINGTTDMSAGAADDDGFSYALTAIRKKQGAIRAIAAGDNAVFVLTDADMVVGQNTDANRAFARETAKYTITSEDGAATAVPEMVDGMPLFLAKDGARLLYAQLDQNGRIRPENLTAISRHIFGRDALKIVRQTSPVSWLWVLLANGDLACCTFEPSQQVVGFSRHSFGGHVTDIEVLPSDDGLTQHLWLVVRRTLGGVDRHCIERMEHPFIDLNGTPAVLADAWHQMCALRWTGVASTDIAGFVHLAGQSVTAWTDFGAFADLTVAEDGSISLPLPVTSAIVGLDVTDSQRFDTLDMVVGQPDGGDDGRLRTHRATGLRVHRSTGGTFEVCMTTDGVAQPGSVAERIFPQWSDPFSAPPLRDGIVELPGHKGWAHQTWLRIRPEPGAPLTITARTPTMMITDD